MPMATTTQTTVRRIGMCPPPFMPGVANRVAPKTSRGFPYFILTTRYRSRVGPKPAWFNEHPETGLIRRAQRRDGRLGVAHRLFGTGLAAQDAHDLITDPVPHLHAEVGHRPLPAGKRPGLAHRRQQLGPEPCL